MTPACPVPASRQLGTTLVVGLILLSLVTLLGLAGASTAHVERLLAQNGSFRENAASAASAGLEHAISQIVISASSHAAPADAAARRAESLPGSTDRFETVTTFRGFEAALPQSPGAHLAGAHFEIVSTGFSGRRAVERQRADVMIVIDGSGGLADCFPAVAVRCFENGDVARLSWQRVAVE